MTASPQQPITLSILKVMPQRRGNRGRYDLEKLPPAEHISYNQEMVGKQFGYVRIISAEKRWNKRMNHCYVLTQCVSCQSIQWTELGNLRRGKSKGCQQCSQPRQIPLWLDRRFTAAKQRCENPNDKGYPNYGGRGIKFEFSSVTEAGLYLMKLYPKMDRSMEIDRIDSNGNYAPGNLRMISKRENNLNKRTTVLSEFHQKYWPYSYNVVIRKLKQGLTREEIISDACKAVIEKRRNWRTIAERLESMILEMPDHIIVLPYQGN